MNENNVWLTVMSPFNERLSSIHDAFKLRFTRTRDDISPAYQRIIPSTLNPFIPILKEIHFYFQILLYKSELHQEIIDLKNWWFRFNEIDSEWSIYKDEKKTDILLQSK